MDLITLLSDHQRDISVVKKNLKSSPNIPPSLLPMAPSPKPSYSMWLDLSGRLAGPGSVSSNRLDAVAPCMMSSSNVLASRIISRSSIPKSAGENNRIYFHRKD